MHTTVTQLPEELAQVQRRLLDHLGEAGERSLLEQIAGEVSPDAEIGRLRVEVGAQDDQLERVLLAMLAARQTEKVERLAVHPWVRNKLQDELRALEKGGDKNSVLAGEYLFDVRRNYAALRRFPAGPFDWVVSGIPRRWLVEASLAAAWRKILFVMRRMKGFSPVFFLHVAPRPRNRSLVLEKEVLRTYHRVASSLEQQPEMLGIAMDSWFLDKRALAAMPYLEAIHRPFGSAGGLITEMGWAPPDSGYVEKHPGRAELVERGEIRYRICSGLWPRAEVLAWMKAHPEYGE
jgi:hypothetical protein